MKDTSAQLARLVGPCPQCGNGRLMAVSDGELTNMLCTECGACWHPEMERVHRVDPQICPGCAARAACQPSPVAVAVLYPAG